MSGLILTRRPGEEIKIGKNVTIIFLGVKGTQCRVKIDAPHDVSVDRNEIRERKELEPGFNPGEVK